MRRREFFKVGGGLASLALFAGGAKAFKATNGAEHAGLLSFATVNAALNAPTSDISVFGLGGFGSRMASRLAYDVRSSWAGNYSRPAFIALDTETNPDSVLKSAGTVSPSSLVILMAGMGGTAGTALIQELAQRVRRTGAFTVVVVSIPEGDPKSAHHLLHLREAADVVFARKLSGLTLASNIELSFVEHSRSLLDAEKWMLRCAGGLVQAVAKPSRITLGIDELRTLFSGATLAVHGSAAGRDGQEIGTSGKLAIQQALTCRGTDASKNIRGALVVCSGPTEQLRWPKIQAGQDQIFSVLGSDTSLLLGVQANEYSGYSRVQTDVWLAFS